MPRARHWQLDPYFQTKAIGIATEEECHQQTRAFATAHNCYLVGT